MKKYRWYEVTARRGGVTLQCDAPPFVLHVTNQHIDYAGQWLGSCSGLFDSMRLGTPGKTEYAQDAQEELMNCVIDLLRSHAKRLSDIRPLKVGE